MDRALVERAQRGDRDAFSSLAIELSDQLFGVAHRILRDFDSASDAFQVALVRIWRDLPGLRDPFCSRPGRIAFSSTRVTMSSARSKV